MTVAAAPVVLLHGFAGHADSWELVRAALPGLRTHAITLFGHDPAAQPTGMIPFEDEVARVAGLVRTLGEPVRVCGYSMGGRITLGLLRRFPELVASAILVGANPGLASDPEREQRIAGDEAWARVLEAGGLEEFAAKWQAQPLFATQAQLPEAKLAHQRSIRMRLHAPSLAWSMRSLSLGRMPSYWEALGSAAAPIDVVVGGLDAKFSALAGEMKKRAKPGLARVLVVDGVGHNVLLESPELLARIILDPRETMPSGVTEA